MDNPTKYLRDYMRKHHPGLTISPVITKGGERVATCWINVKLKSGWWSFNIMIPRTAPENGRPLCTVVKHNNEQVWSFEEDHKTHQELLHKLRVHLHGFSSPAGTQFALVEIMEGDPDMITRVYRMDGDEFSLEIESLYKSLLGRLWGMKIRLSAEEKRAIARLMQPQRRS